MSDNTMRTHLVMKLVCSQCGNLLRLSYDEPKQRSDRFSEGQPTGAAMRQTQICVDPCLTCMQPATEVTKALQTIMKHAAKQEG